MTADRLRAGARTATRSGRRTRDGATLTRSTAPRSAERRSRSCAPSPRSPRKTPRKAGAIDLDDGRWRRCRGAARGSGQSTRHWASPSVRAVARRRPRRSRPRPARAARSTRSQRSPSSGPWTTVPTRPTTALRSPDVVGIPVRQHEQVDTVDPEEVRQRASGSRIGPGVDERGRPRGADEHRIALADVAGGDIPAGPAVSQPITTAAPKDIADGHRQTRSRGARRRPRAASGRRWRRERDGEGECGAGGRAGPRPVASGSRRWRPHRKFRGAACADEGDPRGRDPRACRKRRADGGQDRQDEATEAARRPWRPVPPARRAGSRARRRRRWPGRAARGWAGRRAARRTGTAQHHGERSAGMRRPSRDGQRRREEQEAGRRGRESAKP
jgi:hypothetical protein